MNKKKLSLIYDKRQKDFIVKYPRRCDGNMVLNTLLGNILRCVVPSEKSLPYNFNVFNFRDELEKRGYDVKTLKFSVIKKEDMCEEK